MLQQGETAKNEERKNVTMRSQCDEKILEEKKERKNWDCHEMQ